MILLDDVVSVIEQHLRGILDEDVDLVTSLSADPWPITADPGQIEQVLVNLAVNARDAMPHGGVLSISTENLIVDEEYAAQRPGLEPGRFVRLQVSDTGSGMDRDVLARAFEPFFTTKPKGEGSGLGLATVHGIITQARGQAQICSEPGFGTTFTALLPATEAALSRHEVPAHPAPTSDGETVLLVEAEDAIREVTGRILARHGYRVISVASGPEAIAVSNRRQDDIHLLVTDVIMPQMPGKEVADRLSVLRPDIRVLYLSGYAQPVLASRGTLQAGVALLQTPFSEAVLLCKVREVLDACP
jgi:hypothetical protein